MATEAKNETAMVIVGGNSYDYDTRIAAMTPDEKSRLLAISSKVDPKDVSTIRVYGSDLSREIGASSDALLKSVRGDNDTEVNELLNDLLGELNMIDVDDISDTKWKRFARRVPVLRKLVKTIDNIMIKYDTIAENVDKITKKMDAYKLTAISDNSTLQNIFLANKAYIEKARELIIALKLREQELQQEIERMQGDHKTEPQDLRDMQSFLTQVQKKITNLQVMEYTFGQNLVQIRITQENNYSIVEKAEDAVTNVLPLWKNELAIAIAMNRQKQSIEGLKKLSNTTNEILIRNAEALKINSINVAKANEDPNILLETLQKTTDSMIETVTTIKQIRDEGAKKRAQTAAILRENTDKLREAIQGITEDK